MKDYTVVNSIFFDKFIQHVREKINTGWELCGGLVTTTEYNNVTRYHQAIVKENAEPEPVLVEKRPVGRPKKVKEE